MLAVESLTPLYSCNVVPVAMMEPSERAVLPPAMPSFSTTITEASFCAAVTAAVRPAPPAPTTTTSQR